MAADPYLIEILVRLRDEASSQLKALQREVAGVKAAGAGRGATGDLQRGFDDLGNSAGDAADEVARHNAEAERLRREGTNTSRVVDSQAAAHGRAADAAGRHADAQGDLVDAGRGTTETFNKQNKAISDNADEMESAEKAAARFEKRLRAVEAAEEDLHARFQDTGSLREYADGLNQITKAYGELANRAKLGSEQADDMLARQRAVRNESSRLGTQSTGGDLTASYKEFDNAVRRGQLTTAEARRGYQNFATDFARVSHSFDNGSDSALRFGRMADEAKTNLASYSAVVKDFATRTREADDAQASIYARFRTGQSNLRGLADGLDLLRQRFAALAREAPVGSAEAENLIGRSRATGADARQFSAHATGSSLTASYKDFSDAVRSGQVSTSEARRGFQDFSNDFRRVSRSFEDGSAAAREFGRMADDAGKKLNNLDLARASGGVEQFVAKASHAFDNVGIKILSLSAQLRGLRLVGIVGFIQQLDTAIVGLAGGLASVAADAAQAAGALGGSLVAGIGQAIPVMGVLLAGLERVKSVFAAVQLSQQIKQQAAFSPGQDASTALQTAESLAAAQNGLTNAYDNVVTAQQRVKQSQVELTQARIDALRNIQDLTLAEKTAAEQQVGAHLSLIQAQQALQQVQASGGSQLELQQAQLAVREARTGVTQANQAVPRARADAARARRLGVSGASSVLSAQQAARQAPIDLANSRFAVQQAQDQLRLAQIQAASPSGSESSTQGQLNYLKSQFSGAQLALFNALSSIESQLKNPNSPVGRIGNAIVAPVAKATQEIAKLLDDPKFMAPFLRLANAISGGLSKILDVKGAGKFFTIMANDATKNVPAITSAIQSILSLFSSIAKAAAPALHMLLTDASKFLDRLADTESSVGGQKRLTAEFSLWEKRLENILRLVGAFHGLLKALATDAAPAGNSLIVSFTSSIKSATEWVQTHGPEVRKFFSDATDVLKILGGLFFSLGRTMIAVFNPSTLKAFAQFAQQILLPVLGDVSRAVGALVTFFLKLFDSLPYGRQLLEGLVGGFVGLLVINKVADAFLVATRSVRALWAAIQVFKDTHSIGNALKAMAASYTNMGNAAKAASDQVKTSAAETETALAEENTAIKASTVPIAGQFDGPNGITGAVKKVPVETAAAMTETEAALTAAEPTLAADGAADGAAASAGFLRGFGALALGAGIVYEIANGIRKALGTGQGLIAGSAAQPGQHQTPQAGEAAAKKLFASGVSGYSSWQQIYLAMVNAGEIKNVGPNAPGANALPGLPSGSGGSHLGGALGFIKTAAGATRAQGLTDAATGIAALHGGAAAALTMAQALVGTPYTWGGGHGGFDTVAALKQMGVDCSGFVSQVLHSAGVPLKSPLTTEGLAGFLTPGKAAASGITVYVKGGTGGELPSTQEHTIIDIGGNWYESGGQSGGGVHQMSLADVQSELGNSPLWAPYHYGGMTSPVTGSAATTGGPGGAGVSGRAVVPGANVAGTPSMPVVAAAHRRRRYVLPAFPHLPNTSVYGSTAESLRTGALFPAFPNNNFTGENDPNKAITLISRFFKSFQTGLDHLKSVGEKMEPATQQINDFLSYSSRAFDTFFPELQATFQQLVTRITDAGETAGFNVNGSGAVTSRGVTAGDATIVSGDQRITRGYTRLRQPILRRLAQIHRERQLAHKISDPQQRASVLTKLNTEYNATQGLLTGVNDQIASSVGTTYGAEQTRVQDMLTGISNRFGTQDAGLTATQGQYQSLGRLDLLPGVDTQLANSSAAQVKSLESALVQAQRMGDKTAVAQITQQIYQLNAAITQYMTQAIQDGISVVQNQAQNDSAKTSMLAGLASVATTQGNFGLAGSLSAASYTNAINSDRNQIAAYSPLLAAAKALGDQGAVDSITNAILALTTDLATNTQALTDNTAATDDVAANYAQSRGQFQSGVYGSLAQVVQTLGSITGNVDLPTLRNIYQASNSSLQGTNNTLAGTLFGDFGVDVRGQNPQQTIASLMGLNLPSMEAGMDPATVTEFEDLINGILANTEAIATNNQQLATLNGQLAQPQSFTSTAFSMFRDAIFTGMGGLTPTYAASLGVVNPSNPGLSGTGAPGQMGGAGVTNIFPLVNPMAPPVDEGTVGQQIAFGMKTPSR